MATVRSVVMYFCIVLEYAKGIGISKMSVSE